jgi:uncharacterized small protein (DUF1192 family)
MTKRTIEILKGDWERLRRAYPDVDEDQLLSEIVLRGRRATAGEPQETIQAEGTLQERLEWLRAWTPRMAASMATLGFELVKNRGRLAEATRLEELTYTRDVELKMDVVPEVKERARILRIEIGRLEAELRSRGGDPDAVEPHVPDDAISVDQAQRAQYETNESRRKATLEFFHRLDEYRK